MSREETLVLLSSVAFSLHSFLTMHPNDSIIASNTNRARPLKIEATATALDEGVASILFVGVGTGILSLLMKGEGEGVMERDCEDSEGECDLLLLLEICAGMTCKSILSLRVVAITVTLHV